MEVMYAKWRDHGGHLFKLNAQEGKVLSEVGTGLLSLTHVDMHEVQLGLVSSQPALQLCTLLSPPMLLHLQVAAS